MTAGDDSLSLRIASVFVILVVGAIGVTLPALVRCVSSGDQPLPPFRIRVVLKLLSALGVGVVLSTAMLHTLPESRHVLIDGLGLEDPPATPDSHEGSVPHEDEVYPWADLIAMGSLLIIYFVERELTSFLESRREEHHEAKASHATNSATDQTSMNNEAAEENAAAKAALKLHVLEVAIAVHSLIIGFTVGALAAKNEVSTLLIALSVHQFCEGVAVGACISTSAMKRIHSGILMAIFAFTAPLGTAIGIIVERSVGENGGKSSDIVQGVFGAIASGVLMYMALCDMIPHLGHTVVRDNVNVTCIQCASTTEVETANEPSHTLDAMEAAPVKPIPAEDEKQPLWLRLTIMVSVVFGASIMAVLAKWA